MKFPQRIISVEGRYVKCFANIADEDKGNYSWYIIETLRHATQKEIEDHLRKICDEKYKPYQNIIDVLHGVRFFYESVLSYNYNKFIDTFYLNGRAVYSKGKLAEIVPQKKKLPRDKDEFEKFLDYYSERITTINIKHFLEDYED